MNIAHSQTIENLSSCGNDDARSTSSASSDRIENPGTLQIARQDVALVHLYLRNHSKLVWTNIGILLALVLVLASSGLMQLIDYHSLSQSTPYCDPGGNFDVTEAYDPWNSKHTFQITLGFGRLSFTAAKWIDVSFDLVIGRGGQFLLTILCFGVFSRCLNRMLENPDRSISYDAYRAIIFERPTLTSTFHLAKEMRLPAVWQAKASILWMAIASIYVVTFPTTISAMTGYSSNVDPYMNGDDGKIPVTYDTFHRVIYSISGADRIQNTSLTSNYLVGDAGFGFVNNPSAESDFQLCSEYWRSQKAESYSTTPSPSRQYEKPFANDCLFAEAISSYIKNYGLNPSHLDETNLTIQGYPNYTVQSPGLVIKMFNTNIARPSSGAHSLFEGNASSPFMYAIANETFGETNIYTHTDINENIGTCDRNKTYMWGFSFILLFIFVIVTEVWALGMYIMWSETFWVSRIDHYGRGMGFYRGVVDVSNAIWKDTLKEPEGLISDSEIRNTLTKNANSGKVALQIDRAKLPASRKDDFQRLRRTVPSLSGWTDSWASLHWFWFMAFTICGSLCAIWPIAARLNDFKTLKVVKILYLLVTCACWLVSVARGFAAILLKVRPAGYLEKIAFFAVAGSVTFFIAMSTPELRSGYSDSVRFEDYKFLIHMNDRSHSKMLKAATVITIFFSASFGLMALILFLVGLVSTVSRWRLKLIHTIRHSLRGHQYISKRADGLSGRDPINGTELDYTFIQHPQAESEQLSTRL